MVRYQTRKRGVGSVMANARATRSKARGAFANSVAKVAAKASRYGAKLVNYATKKAFGVKIMSDTEGNQSVVKKIGRPAPKLSYSMENKIRKSLTAVNHQLFQDQGKVLQTSPGFGTFEVFELNDCPEVYDLMTQNGITPKRTGKFNIHDSSMEIIATNQSSNQYDIRIYEYVARQDLPATLDTGTGSTVNPTTEWVVENGFSFMYGGNKPTQFALSVTLFDNPLFCSYYKILNVRNISLPAGRTLNLKMDCNRSRSINPLLWSQVDTVTDAGYTRGYVIQVRSQMIFQNDASAAGSTGYISLPYVQLRRYNWTWLEPGTSKGQIEDNINHTITSPSYVNPQSGAIASQVIA